MVKSAQFVRQHGAVHPRFRLFCFPFAGGSPAVFSGWGQQLGPEIEVLAAHPRGRGMRFRERPDVLVHEMVEDFFSVLRTHLDLPFILYGHSLGGLIAFEITRLLELQGLRMPEHLMLGASAPPHLGLIHEAIHHLPNPEFVEALQDRYAGIPQEVLREPDLLAMFLPALKADFTAYELYQFAEANPVSCPITVFAGESDPGIQPSLLEEWSRHTSREFSLETLAGDHFFLSESSPIVLASIRNAFPDGSAGKPAISNPAMATEA
jgi:medium-chain acyl-[acyl-carrier-protein] hydrolase